ncbi:hypothetical protein BDZ97DRAFT_2078444 [Flammula alnicola]|nr:hypothetical protein BDZ97DRAFT_2078444 [Flammula alnicola]
MAGKSAQGTRNHSIIRQSNTPLPRTRCIYHVIDLILKGQSWRFSQLNLKAEEISRVEELWDQLRAAVDVNYGIIDALQAVTDFILSHDIALTAEISAALNTSNLGDVSNFRGEPDDDELPPLPLRLSSAFSDRRGWQTVKRRTREVLAERFQLMLMCPFCIVAFVVTAVDDVNVDVEGGGEKLVVVVVVVIEQCTAESLVAERNVDDIEGEGEQKDLPPRLVCCLPLSSSSRPAATPTSSLSPYPYMSGSSHRAAAAGPISLSSSSYMSSSSIRTAAAPTSSPSPYLRGDAWCYKQRGGGG